MVSVPAPPTRLSDLAAVTAALENSRVAVDEIALRRPTLDDAFLALTGQTLDGDQENDPEEVVR